MSKQINLYHAMGQEVGIRQLVDHFYDYMESLPEAQDILNMHPKDLTTTRDKFFMFLVGWTGGPKLFVEKFGHPRLRMRHLTFEIGVSERDQWILCFTEAVKKMNYHESVTEVLIPAIVGLADHMRNKKEI